MGKNGYLEKRKKQIDTYRQAEKDTYVQHMVDMFSLTLSDPEVMGKDVFGKDRLSKVIHAVEKNYDTYHTALEKHVEADYYQEQIDKKLRASLGDENVVPFEKRYDWLVKQKY